MPLYFEKANTTEVMSPNISQKGIKQLSSTDKYLTEQNVN